MSKRHCCEKDCKKDATYEISGEGKTDRYDTTDSCDEHISELLYVGECNTITEIKD